MKRTQKTPTLEDFEKISESVELENLKSQPVEDNLLAYIERVNEMITLTHLRGEFEEAVKPFVDYLAQKLELSFDEVVFFCMLMEMNTQHEVDLEDISNKFKVTQLRIRRYSGVANDLKRKKFIKLGTNPFRDCKTFHVWDRVADQISKNQTVTPDVLKGLTNEQFFGALSTLLDEYDDSRDIRNLVTDARDLLQDNTHLNFCETIKAYWNESNEREKVLLIVCCVLFVCHNDENVGVHNWEGFMSKSDVLTMRHSLKRGMTFLQQKGIIEDAAGDGLRDNYYYRLTREVKERLFADVDVEIDSKEPQKNGLKSYSEILEKPLYYNPEDEKMMQRITTMLMPEKFKEVQKTLEDNGFRNGCAILLHGPAGTGKTESVYQIAKATQRDLFIIDVANIKSAFVGESEKNITAAFHKYAQLVASSKNAPIILFNEADAILGNRMEGAQRAVDKMENSIQNIILQEMENLHGIMIATTNLTKNLDPAFERRFLFKVKLDKPGKEAKAKIWKSMIKDLTKSEAEELAEKYDFSGGQIENIARKYTAEMIISGTKPTIELIREFCNTELIDNSQIRNRVGF